MVSNDVQGYLFYYFILVYILSSGYSLVKVAQPVVSKQFTGVHSFLKMGTQNK